MWTKFSLPNDDRPLSPVEMLTLVLVPEDVFLPAPELIKRINDEMGTHYTGKRGTIYPILHRLRDRQLVELDTSSKLEAKRTTAGSDYLTMIASDLRNYLRSNFRYTEIIIEELVELDPHLSIDLLDNLFLDVDLFKEDLEGFKKKAVDLDKDEWTDIPIG
ncbi:MAG: helix-turn-helix transcriptional regulator [Candidatus Heimdallarchaeota archaeon]|nr:helix-turn-helix transcriptional regulator [Candidatus Heimdallarchaeota archaeon]